MFLDVGASVWESVTASHRMGGLGVIYVLVYVLATSEGGENGCEDKEEEWCNELDAS